MSTSFEYPKPPYLRTLTASSSPSSSASSSVTVSPFDSPRQSPSTTSLTSLSDLDDASTILKQSRGTLIDGYGNEFDIPDYTIKQIRDAIPAHCFERSGLRGLAYVARDMACIAATFYLFHNHVTAETVPYPPVRFALWGIYAFVQGLFGTGVWVLAHECGHQSFSPSKTLNDTVGWVLHSALLVPYFSWKISHGKHHKATGNMARDMVFVPKTREQYASYLGRKVHEFGEVVEEAPIVTLFWSLIQQLFGWPWYLLTNVTGHNNHERQTEGKGKGKKNGLFGRVNHFDPKSPLYEKKDEHLILLSDLGLVITATALVLIGRSYGWLNLLVWYGLPYLWVNHWLVAITYLQHTDPSLPHYKPETWTFTRGAAATIDREFGFIGRHLFHGIIETHVLHHYVSTIPFYNADEATEAIKPVMGKHYKSDVENGSWGFIRSLWRSSRWCQWVEPSEEARGEGKGIVFYRNRNGLGTAPAKLSDRCEEAFSAKRGIIIGDESD